MIVRRAREADVPAIVRLLADDVLGRSRQILGPPLPQGYFEAFREIDADPKSRLLVGEIDGAVVATLQLTFLRRMSRAGYRVCDVESVHVASDRRNQGLGAKLMAAALDEARAAGCSRVQLTSDQRRQDAHRFYERLGFARSHFGFKLEL